MRNSTGLAAGAGIVIVIAAVTVTWAGPLVLSWWQSITNKPKVDIKKPKKDTENDLEQARKLKQERTSQENSTANPGRNPNALHHSKDTEEPSIADKILEKAREASGMVFSISSTQ